MAIFKHRLGNQQFVFNDLADLLAKASPLKSGDQLAGLAAPNHQTRMAAKFALADTPLQSFLDNPLIPYEKDEITRLIIDTHDKKAFAKISHFTVGEFRDYLLDTQTTSFELNELSKGITPEMAAAVSKIMRNQDLILVASKVEVITKFRTTLGLANSFSTRLQPNHTTDDPKAISLSIIDGLLNGSGDALVGINPASDHLINAERLLNLIDEFRIQFDIPIQSCVLTHITNTQQLIEKGAPVDIVFQSIAGSQKANQGFGVDLKILSETQQAALELNRGTLGDNLMYFETGQGSALSSNSHFEIDQQTIEARAYAVARAFNPLLVNTVVGFIGPEYLYDGKQIIRAGLEDHFCGKLLGLPMGCDICYTNHAEADQNDMDNLLTLLGCAGVHFIMGVPGADDIMLNYQSTSFQDANYIRQILKRKCAPEFEEWLLKMNQTSTEYLIQFENIIAKLT